jgi:hypothetical protein
MMLAFAVTVEGVTAKDKAKWVMDVDPVGERFLIVNGDMAFQWVPMADCTFVRPRAPTSHNW